MTVHNVRATNNVDEPKEKDRLIETRRKVDEVRQFVPS